MFDTVLVANRGEIALRIISTLQDHGIRAVVTASDPDLNSLPVKKADDVLHLQGSVATDTYLNIEKIIESSLDLGIDAVHPGYGFLAENPLFATAVETAKMTFIGPTAEQMKIFGDKIEARKLAVKSETPLIQGTTTDLSDDDILEEARKIGFPILIKAAAGGGGRGIRMVRDESEIETQLNNARKEAKLAFNDDRVFIEKFVEFARHIEVQVLGLGGGEVLHFGERDCSMQRKNQKLIEEAPAPTITREIASDIHETAIKLTSVAKYKNAGTVEFLYDPKDKQHYFLEVNARIQVEHPVSEFVSGQDLVWRQIQVAAGEELGIDQGDIHMHGHSIEARIYAENPFTGFTPSPGKIYRIRHPFGAGIRTDSAVTDGDVITPFYDPMISKLVVHSTTRNSAINRLQKALDDYLITGVHTTAAYIRELVKTDNFIHGDYHTKYLDDYDAKIPDTYLKLARVLSGLKFTNPEAATTRSGNGEESISKWRTSTWPGRV